MKLFEDGYYIEATVTNFTQQSRSSFYEYVFEYNKILSSPRKSYYSGYNLEVGGKYIVLINPKKLDESLLLHPFTVPDSLVGKNIVWKKIPTFLDEEKVLNFLQEY